MKKLFVPRFCNFEERNLHSLLIMKFLSNETAIYYSLLEKYRDIGCFIRY